LKCTPLLFDRQSSYPPSYSLEVYVDDTDWARWMRQVEGGQLFRKSKGYADDHYDRWYILSAKYYLLDPDRRIEPYERNLARMSAQEKIEWSRVVLKSIMEKHPDPERVKLFVHAGAEYRRYLLPLLEENGYTCDVPLEGLKIGEQMRWYNSHGSRVP
jgi:Family of unknown function (DUF6884)